MLQLPALLVGIWQIRSCAPAQIISWQVTARAILLPVVPSGIVTCSFCWNCCTYTYSFCYFFRCLCRVAWHFQIQRQTSTESDLYKPWQGYPSIAVLINLLRRCQWVIRSQEELNAADSFSHGYLSCSSISLRQTWYKHFHWCYFGTWSS